ncbi:hypothetical protein FQN54_003619 [Arachnomyces sp. PD_36]|nr:hypothetical protein FQN54_003619 [Arachnomyces sp. PD_36]
MDIIIFLKAVAPLRERFVSYGPRAASSKPEQEPEPDSTEPEITTKTHETKPARLTSNTELQTPTLIDRSLDYLASWKVPHSYFTQFYVVSLISSIFWATQIIWKGPAFRIVSALYDADSAQGSSMSVNQVLVCSALMAIQGARRLYECVTLSKPSQSTMWIAHYILGILYYLAMTVAVWIEGMPALRSTDIMYSNARISPPSLRTMIFFPVFLFASGIQHDCHVYLASLKKYTLPVHPAFLSVVCPHYTAECMIYVSLAFLAAPQGQIVNKTLLSGLIFVVVNLGVSAGISKEWYIGKFGKESVQHRWKMIPGVY